MGDERLQGTFPWIKKQLSGDAHICKRTSEAIVFVHNFHTHIIGCNEIKTVLTLI